MKKSKIINDIIKKQLSNHSIINLEDLEKKLKNSKKNYLKFIINGKKIKVEEFSKCKRNRRNPFLFTLRKVVQKFPNLNTIIYCDINDWSNKDMIDEPIFVYSAFKGTKNFVIPDYLFLNDYSNNSGRNNDKDSHDNMVLKYRNKYNFEDKKSKCFFRAGTVKNNNIIKMFKNYDLVDACKSSHNWMEYEEMFKHKYVISHYMKWDSVYFFLKSDIFTFLYDGFGTYLWYDLFLEEDVHYYKFKTKEEFDDKINHLENNSFIAKQIIENSSKVVDDFFNMETAIDYIGNLLLEYQKLVI